MRFRGDRLSCDDTFRFILVSFLPASPSSCNVALENPRLKGLRPRNSRLSLANVTRVNYHCDKDRQTDRVQRLKLLLVSSVGSSLSLFLCERITKADIKVVLQFNNQSHEFAVVGIDTDAVDRAFYRLRERRKIKIYTVKIYATTRDDFALAGALSARRTG